MKLKRLEIMGFKSFADKTVIAFNEGITGIVGPNGSGKSNIGDAVRWVLGEQSVRVLRGSKMEDIIFNGTAVRKPASYAEVSLVFDNEDHMLDSTFTDVMVTRRVYRNGDSDYYLNQNACRLKDILSLFRDTGIGREGYSLIGQGRIDEILSVKGEERRQVFEEAAGVVTFRVRKEEAERKLSRTRENLSRVQDIISELEDRLEPLALQSETAKVYLELANQLKSLEINIFLVRYDKLQERMASLEQTAQGLRQILEQHEEALRMNQEERSEIERLLSELDVLGEEARKAHYDENEKLHSLQLERQEITQKIENAQAVLENTESEIENENQRLKELSAFNDAGTDEKQLASEQLAELLHSLNQERAKLDNAGNLAQEKEDELNAHKSGIVQAMNKMSDIQTQKARQQTMLAQMEKRLEELKETQRGSETSVEALKDTLSASADAVESADGAYREAQGAYNRQQEETQKMSDRLREEAEKTQELSARCAADQTKLSLMKDMADAMEGYNQSVRRAMQYARNDSGVYDVVARIIETPKEYETAVNMVLGGALQNIVTEDEDAAKRVIEYLRRNNYGRVTFLPLTTVRSRTLTQEETRVLNMKGCIGVASELVHFDEKYRGIIENLLGRTIIAENLECGIPIMRTGRQAFRLVTLQGDVMHSGGSMTGGTVHQGQVSLLGREREMKELAVFIEQQQKQLQKKREYLETEKQTLELQKNRRNELFEHVQDLQIACVREQEHLKKAKDEYDTACESLQKVKEAVAQLNDGMEVIRQDLSRIESVSSSDTVDMESMESRTRILQDELYSAREEVEKQRSIVEEAQRLYTQQTYEIELMERDSTRRTEEIERITRNIDVLKGKNAVLREKLSEQNRQLETVSRNMEACAAEVEGKAKTSDEIERKRREQLLRQKENAEENDRLHAQFDTDTQKLHRTELSFSKAENDLKTMTDHIFNTYELTYASCEEFRIQEGFNLGESENAAAQIRSKIREMGTVNVSSIEEYALVKERYDGLMTQKEDLNKAETDLNLLITRLLSQMEKQFVSEFVKLNEYFGVTFRRLFGGGTAELRLADANDPLNCNIEIIAQPPGKKLQLLSLLSGGERALTAIAILFAMLKLKPTPFCILDEIEAALDEANIGYFADYLAEYKQGTQFVVVTHRKGTMERCDALYGVAMQEKGISRMVSVNLQDYKE